MCFILMSPVAGAVFWKMLDVALLVVNAFKLNRSYTLYMFCCLNWNYLKTKDGTDLQLGLGIIMIL